MTKFVATVLMFAITGGFFVAHGQQPTADLLSDSDKAQIIESVLDLELQAQASVPDFANVRNVSGDNIEFIEPSWLSKHGFAIVASSKLRESKKDHIVEYLLFRKIYSRDDLAVVELSSCCRRTITRHRRASLLRRGVFHAPHLNLRGSANLY